MENNNALTVLADRLVYIGVVGTNLLEEIGSSSSRAAGYTRENISGIKFARSRAGRVSRA